MSDDTRHWFTTRRGSQIVYYKPLGGLEGVVEVHPDHPPIMHWIDGRDEELRCDPEGRAIVNVPSPFQTITIDVGNPDDYPFQMDVNYIELK